MRDFAKSPPKFWIDECWRKIKTLSLEARVLAPYLLSNPHSNMIGIYYLPIPFMAHETGLSCEAALQAFTDLCESDFCSYDAAHEYVWVHKMASDQLGGQLKENDNRVICANKIYADLPDLHFLADFYAKYSTYYFLEAPSKPLASKEKEKKKDNNKEKKIFMSGKPDVSTLKNSDNEKSKTQKQDHAQLKSQAMEVLNFLNEKTGRGYRPGAINLNFIMARLKSGASVMDCRQIIAKKNREWKGDTKMAEYLRPATLFNATKFEQYLGELVIPEEEKVYES